MGDVEPRRKRIVASRIKDIILLCSLLAIAIGHFYNQSDGLIIGVNHDRGKIYSNSLQSSGGDDGSIMAMGFLSFGLSVIASTLTYARVISIKKLSIIYFVNFLILLFFAFLVNLDVSVFDSIKYGDLLLLSGFLITVIPFFFIVRLHKASDSGPEA